MQNWAGQEISVGDIVWRGARDGNSSSFKIGRVIGFDTHQRKVKVQWLFEPGYYHFMHKHVPQNYYKDLPCVSRMDSKGSPSVDTITVVDVDLDELGKIADKLQELENQGREFDRQRRVV